MYWRPLTFCLNWNVLKIISLRKLEWFCTYQKTVERQLKKGDGSICNNVNATDNTEISPIACTVETPRSTLAVGRTGKVCRLHTCVTQSRDCLLNLGILRMRNAISILCKFSDCAEHMCIGLSCSEC